MTIKRTDDDAENSMMATDLFAALFVVMLLAVGTTPAVKKAAADRDLNEIPDKQPLYIYASIDGGLRFGHVLNKAIPLASLSSVLKKRIDSHKSDTVIIVFPKDAKASQMDNLIQKVESATDLTVAWTWL